MIYFLVTGAVLGISAGLAPGPLLALMVTETLKHGIRTGVRVALVPVCTDLPIIFLTLFVLEGLATFHPVLACISFIGGGFILFMGYEALCTRGIEITPYDYRPDSFRRGIIINVVNPHPYLFWFSVGSPMINKAMEQDVTTAMVFVGSFYLMLVGSKITLAILVGRSRSFLTDNVYICTMRTMGILLFILALLLFQDGLELLGFPWGQSRIPRGNLEQDPHPAEFSGLTSLD